MHRHDLDLIAALADGSLEDETRALSRVETCSDCRAEYEAQRTVLASLAAAGPVAMTDHEKAALHRDLWTELRTGDATATSTAPWWFRWSYAAAGLFIFVGLTAVVSQMIGGDDAADFAETGSALAPASADGAGAEAESDEQAVAALDEAESASTTALAAEAADSEGEVSAAAPVDFGLLSLTLTETLGTQQTRTVIDQNGYTDCLATAGLDDHTVVETYSLEAGNYIAVVANDAVADSEVISFVDLATCEVVYTDR